MQKTMLIVLIVCFTVSLTSIAMAGGYQSRYGFGTGNFKAPDPLGLNNGDPLDLGNSYKYKYKKSKPKRPMIYGSDGQMYGYVNTENGVVYSTAGKALLRIDRDKGVYSTTGKLLGRIADDGSLYRRDGLYMGRIK